MEDLRSLRKMSDRELKARKRAIRRRMVIRRRVAVFASALVLILFTVFSVQMIANASSDNEVVKFKYFKNIMIEPGQTLTGLANNYMDIMYYDSTQDYIEEVCQMNHIDDADVLVSGQYIIVPYYSTEFKDQ